MEEGCYNNCNFTDNLYFRGIFGVNVKNLEPDRKAGNRNRTLHHQGGLFSSYVNALMRQENGHVIILLLKINTFS